MSEKENLDKESNTSTTLFIPKEPSIDEKLLASMHQISRNNDSTTDSSAITLDQNDFQLLCMKIKEEVKNEMKSELKKEIIEEISDIKESFLENKTSNIQMEYEEYSEPIYKKITKENYEFFEELKKKDYSKFILFENPNEDEE